jgi:HEPN domain-containing protein
MNPLVAEWVGKAEGDFTSAQRELRAKKAPNYDSACFHSQQCVEKYMKGILQRHDIAFAKTHDLGLLLDACVNIYPLWQGFRPDMEMLSQYSVAFRYPGVSASKAEANQAVKAASKLRDEFRKVLRLRE